MKFSAVAIFATAASAAAVERQAASGYTVTNFAATCIPNGSYCEVNFRVRLPGSTAELGALCLAQFGADSGNTIAGVANQSCVDPTLLWSLNKSTAGLTLVVTQGSAGGSHTIQYSELVGTASSGQSYAGPTTFDLV